MPFLTGHCGTLCDVSTPEHNGLDSSTNKMLNGQNGHNGQNGAANHPIQYAPDTSVAQALEIARDSPDGANDPTVSGILERALARLWAKVEAHPDSYVLTRDEFAVFNFFQHRFTNNHVAQAARGRFWDNLHV